MNTDTKATIITIFIVILTISAIFSLEIGTKGIVQETIVEKVIVIDVIIETSYSPYPKQTQYCHVNSSINEGIIGGKFFDEFMEVGLMLEITWERRIYNYLPSWKPVEKFILVNVLLIRN